MSDNEQLIADLQSDNDALIKKLDQLDERVLELERHNELLQDALEECVDSLERMMIVSPYLAYVVVTKKMEAAIDGGALDGEK